MAFLSKQALLGASKPPQEIVRLNVAGFSGDVTVRGMTGAERDAFEVSLVQGKGRHRDVNLRNLRAKLVAYCCIDEQGDRMFSDADAEALGQVRADVLNKLYSVAQRLSGITDEDADELGQPSTQKVGPTSPSGLLVN